MEAGSVRFQLLIDGYFYSSAKVRILNYLTVNSILECDCRDQNKICKISAVAFQFDKLHVENVVLVLVLLVKCDNAAIANDMLSTEKRNGHFCLQLQVFTNGPESLHPLKLSIYQHPCLVDFIFSLR